MLTFPSVIVANAQQLATPLPLFCIQAMFLIQGCTQKDSAATLPHSALATESWLQTSRLIRYSFPDGSNWQGWVLHTESAPSTGIAIFDSQPTYQDWKDCIRQQSRSSTWLSSTVETLLVTKQYAIQMNSNLPTFQVEC